MRKLAALAVLVSSLSACGGAGEDVTPPNPPTPGPAPQLSADLCYLMDTTMGEISLAVDNTHTPVTGNNFASYVDEQFYDQTLFHRVINNFMIQGGGFTTGMVNKPGRAPIVNEANVGFSNLRGTIAMARTNVPNSATSQFFINTLNNPQLDYSASSVGYAVFGQVIAGMEVVDQVSITPTAKQGVYSDVPVVDVVINSVTKISCPAG